MRFVIYGAGGIGGTIGAQLQLSGESVLFIARGEHGRCLQKQGLRYATPAGTELLPVAVALHPSEVRWHEDDLVLLCVKSQQSQAALDALYRAGVEQNFAINELPLVCAQNGVANEALALRAFRHVYAMLVQLPATHLRPGEVVVSALEPMGILDTGCYPKGVDAVAQTLCERLQRAGFQAVADPKVMRKKYGKLLSNLFNALQLLLPLDSGWSAETQRLLKALRREALDCYAAAGIDCMSKAEGRELAARMNLQEVPGHARQGGSTWQSLARGTGDTEVDFLNGEVAWLGRLHGVPTPANEVCQRLATELVMKNGAPGQWTVAAIEQEIHRVSEKA